MAPAPGSFVVGEASSSRPRRSSAFSTRATSSAASKGYTR
jgi:hypothetical protein